jgi:hypothetical protein
VRCCLHPLHFLHLDRGGTPRHPSLQRQKCFHRLSIRAVVTYISEYHIWASVRNIPNAFLPERQPSSTTLLPSSLPWQASLRTLYQLLQEDVSVFAWFGQGPRPALGNHSRSDTIVKFKLVGTHPCTLRLRQSVHLFSPVLCHQATRSNLRKVD